MRLARCCNAQFYGNHLYYLTLIGPGNTRITFDQAMREWENKTCIRFVHATDNDTDYLLLTDQNGYVTSCMASLPQVGSYSFFKGACEEATQLNISNLEYLCISLESAV